MTDWIDYKPPVVDDEGVLMILPATRMVGETWENNYRWRWDALEATIEYYSTHMEDWD